jgi:hypothetical protein
VNNYLGRIRHTSGINNILSAQDYNPYGEGLRSFSQRDKLTGNGLLNDNSSFIQELHQTLDISKSYWKIILDNKNTFTVPVK